MKLPQFCSNNIRSWFGMAEGHFVLQGINDELVCYYNVLTALPESVVNCIADFVEAHLPADPYTQLRIHLLAAHQMSDYQKVEEIKRMPALGAQKPSEFLNEMLRICPRGQEANIKQNFATGKLSAADKQAMEESGLCFYHFAYANEAQRCRKPCAWAGN